MNDSELMEIVAYAPVSQLTKFVASRCITDKGVREALTAFALHVLRQEISARAELSTDVGVLLRTLDAVNGK
jgi:hypothetical protein